MENSHSSTRRNPFVRDSNEEDAESDDEPSTKMSRTTLRTILKKDLGMRPYHLQIAHALEDRDYLSQIHYRF
jgi:hypothetical protein